MFSDTFTYLTVNLSVLRIGATLFPISPRNSAPAIAHLLQTTGVTAILVGGEPSLNRLASAAFNIIRNSGGVPPTAAQMPTFGDMFLACSDGAIDTEEFLPPLGWRRHDVAGLIVHSSGPYLFPVIAHVFEELTGSPTQVLLRRRGLNQFTGLTVHSLSWLHFLVSFPIFSTPWY
jgi:acyl-CoA synthetase (AMP-forming)/AMP-acid ligase II